MRKKGGKLKPYVQQALKNAQGRRKSEAFKLDTYRGRGPPKEGRRTSILKPVPKVNQKQQLWEKLTAIVEKRKVRFSRFLTVTDQISGNTSKQVDPNVTSPSPDKMVKRRGAITTPLEKKYPISRTISLDKNKDPESLGKPLMMKTLQQLKIGLPTKRHGSTGDLLGTGRSATVDISATDSDSRLLSTSPAVFEIIDSLQTGKKNRLRQEIYDELEGVHKRVKDALKTVEMYEDGEDLKKVTRFPPINSLEIMKQKREKMYQEKGIMEQVETYKGNCKERLALLAEIESWLGAKNLISELSAEADLQKMVRYFQEIHSSVMTTLHHYGNSSDKVLDLGNQLLTATSAIVQENQENARKIQEKQKEKTIVYDERQLLSDQAKWESAVKLVMSTFDDAMKWTKNQSYKQIYKKGQTQFKELSSGMKKRNVELKEKRKAVEDTKMKLQAAKTDMEGKSKDLEELRKQARKLTTEVEEKKHLLSMAEEKNLAMSQKCLKYEGQIKTLQDELRKKPTVVEKVVTVTPPRTPTPPPPEIIKVIDSSTQLKLEETEKELEEVKGKLQSLKDEIRKLERNLRLEKERIRQLRSELEEAKRRAAEAEMTVKIPEPTPDPVPEVPIIDSTDKDSTYYKTLLAGMKRDFTAELEKIKGHLNKERQRNNASVKRVENVHKEQLASIQKDVVRVLRAIMHFKDHLCSILEKESLKDIAASLNALGSLVPDKLAPDPRELLALLVGNVVEYLHNMEVVIGNAFLTMRMMIKGSITVNANKEVVAAKKSETKVKVEEAQRNIKRMDQANIESKKIAARLKKAKEKLIKFEELTESQEVHDRKYLALLDRYRRVWKMYNHLNKDMKMLQADFQDAVEEKLREREDLLVTQIKMELKDRKTTHERELKLSISEQKKNLKLLEHAYEDNKISKDLYNMAVSLLEAAIEIPKKRLRYMMEQYIAFKTVEDTRSRVNEILTDESLSKSVRKDMETYVKKIDEKLTCSMNVWHDKMNVLNEEKKFLFQSIWKTFNAVFAETGILLVHPLLNRSSTDKADIYARVAATLTRDTLQNMCMNRHKRIGYLLQLPTVLEGSSVLYSMTNKQSLWNAQFSCGDDNNHPALYVSTPHTINYEVNRERIKAKQILVKQHVEKPVFRMARPVYKLPQSQNYFIGEELQLTY